MENLGFPVEPEERSRFMKKQFEQKIMHFATALSDVYKDDEEKESTAMAPLELKEEELTEDFTAMIYAQWALYRRVTEEDIDVLGFTHIVNRLVLQKIMEDNGALPK